jgi:hemolysin-activating ACP:hemolysin acyltransferase
MSREGSVKKDGSGKWMFVVDVVAPGGKRKQVRRRGFRLKDHALDELDAVKAAAKVGGARRAV